MPKKRQQGPAETVKSKPKQKFIMGLEMQSIATNIHYHIIDSRGLLTSPAPALMGCKELVRYALSKEVNVEPVTFPNTAAVIQLSVVQVTRGCTTLTNFFGSRAPKTKLVRVVLSINSEASGVENALSGLRDERMAAPPLARVTARRALLSVSEKGFGGGGGDDDVSVDDNDDVLAVVSVASGSITSSISASFLVGSIFLTPITVHAVDNKVK